MSGARGRLVFPAERAAARLPPLPHPRRRRRRADAGARDRHDARERAPRRSRSIPRPAGSRGSSTRRPAWTSPGGRRARGRRRRPLRHLGPRRARVRRSRRRVRVRLGAAGRAGPGARGRCGSRAASAPRRCRGARARRARGFVDVRVALDWREQLKLLKLRFPTSIQTATRDLRGAVRPPRAPGDGDEEPAQAWVDVSDGGRGPRGPERREVRPRRARRRHRGHRRAQPGLRVARPAGARARRATTSTSTRAAQDFIVPPGPARWRLARGGHRRALAAELNQPPFALIESFHAGAAAARRVVRRGRRRRRRRDRAQGGRGRRRARRARLRERGRPRARRSSCRSSAARSTPTSAPPRSRRCACRATGRAGRGDQPARVVTATRRRRLATPRLPRRRVGVARPPDKPWDAPGWLPARVPGSVARRPRRVQARSPTLLRAQLPARRMGPRASVGLPARLPGAGCLRFAGVDHEATVFIDGEQVGGHEGTFTPFEVESPAGDHLLAVVVAPGAAERAAGRARRAACACTRAAWATAGTSARGSCTRASGARSRTSRAAGRIRA